MIRLPFVFSRLPERKRKTRSFEVQAMGEFFYFLFLPFILVFFFFLVITASNTQAARTKWCADTYGAAYSYTERDNNGICAIVDKNKEAKASEVKEYKGEQ